MQRARSRSPAAKALRAFLRLPPGTQVLALEAALLLLLARLLVEHVPMRYWRHRLDIAPAPEPPPAPQGRTDGSAGPPRSPSGSGEGSPASGAPPAVRAGRSARPGPSADTGFPRRVGRIVRKVARRAPFRARCLPRAMAAQWMLRRRGVRSRVVFGVRRGGAPEPGLEFHAWLIVAGECVIGAGELEAWSPFLSPGAVGSAANTPDSPAMQRGPV